jgi:ABC-type lipoprotein release transport system permease subunit
MIAMVLKREVAPGEGNSMAIWTCLLATASVAAMTCLACVAPTRRALRIQPTDALKAE